MKERQGTGIFFSQTIVHTTHPDPRIPPLGFLLVPLGPQPAFPERPDTLQRDGMGAWGREMLPPMERRRRWRGQAGLPQVLEDSRLTDDRQPVSRFQNR